MAVNYHYIGGDRYPYPGIYSITPSCFKKQIEMLGTHFSFVSQTDLLKALAGEKDLPEFSCMITFDDGLSCQYEQALPVLDTLGVPAIFFINGLPYAEDKVLTVHKIHWCRSHLDPRDFYEKFKKFYKHFTGRKFDYQSNGASDSEIKKQYSYDDLETARLKFLLSKSNLDEDLREKIIDTIFKELVSDEREFCSTFYFSKQQIKDLYRRSYLGIHSYSHRPLGKLRDIGVEKEIYNCLNAVTNVLGDDKAKIYGISYPYGTSDLVSPEVASISASAGLKFGFTMERSFNRTLRDPLLFARLDSNDVPGGQSPLFEIKENNLKFLNDKLKKYRTHYTNEK